MRKIVAGLFMSLDGVVEAPETWHFPYFNDEMGKIVSDPRSPHAVSARTGPSTTPGPTRSSR